MKKIFAILLIVGGSIALLNNLGYLNVEDIFQYLWPIFIILIGLSGLKENTSGKLFPLVLVLVGVVFLARAFGYLYNFDLTDFIWPGILILIGVSILFPKSRAHMNVHFHTSSEGKEKSEKHWNVSDRKEYTAFMAGLEEKVVSTDFKRISVNVVMGGADLDLREITLQDNDAYIEINAVMGGVEIILPRGYRLDIEGTPILGAFENHCESNPNADKTLHISYAVIMGGIEIKH